VPLHADREHYGDVSKQRQRQPLEIAYVTSKGHENLQSQADGAEEKRVAVLRTADDQLQRFAHCRDVGGDVDRVGNDEHRDDHVQHRPRKLAADIGRKAVPCDTANPRTHHLNSDHQRIGQHDGPSKLVAELRTGLRVRRDAARIIVGSAGNEAGSELAQPAAGGFDHPRIVRREDDGRC